MTRESLEQAVREALTKCPNCGHEPHKPMECDNLGRDTICDCGLPFFGSEPIEASLVATVLDVTEQQMKRYDEYPEGSVERRQMAYAVGIVQAIREQLKLARRPKLAPVVAAPAGQTPTPLPCAWCGTVPHPASYIIEEMLERDWSSGDVARRMPGDYGVNKLALDMLLMVGPHDRNALIGDDMDAGLCEAFGVSKGMFTRLEKAWRDSLPAAPAGEERT
ncbi:MAG TPA: hypothetical protein VHL34_24625 [Rhizomicrobium sp.]|jgi:hypothetical protein|nr:hypothetical protein [Rhizomicrobium sp.]